MKNGLNKIPLIIMGKGRMIVRIYEMPGGRMLSIYRSKKVLKTGSNVDENKFHKNNDGVATEMFFPNPESMRQLGKLLIKVSEEWND